MMIKNRNMPNMYDRAYVNKHNSPGLSFKMVHENRTYYVLEGKISLIVNDTFSELTAFHLSCHTIH